MKISYCFINEFLMLISIEKFLLEMVAPQFVKRYLRIMTPVVTQFEVCNIWHIHVVENFDPGKTASDKVTFLMG